MMLRSRYVFMVSPFLIALWTFCAVAGESVEGTPAGKKLHVAVVTGGHRFNETEFLKIFQSLYGITFEHHPEKVGGELFEDISNWPYDVVVLYNYQRKITPKQQKNFLRLMDQGIGLVVLHHANDAYLNWPEYSKITGVVFHNDKWKQGGVEMARSGWKDGVKFKVHVADPDHPIVQGLVDYDITDETYCRTTIDPDVDVLLTTEEPTSDKILGWTKTYRNSRVCYLQSGHGPTAYKNPNYIKLVRRAIRWSVVAMKSLIDIAVEQTPEHQIRFRSGKTIYVEALLGDRWVGRSWNTEGREDLPLWKAAEPAFLIEIKDNPEAKAGKPFTDGWQWVSASELAKTDRGARHFVVELSNKSFPIQLKVHTLLDGTPILTRWLEITNNAAKSIALTGVSPWTGRLWAEDAPVTLGHAIKMTVEESKLRPRISEDRNEGWFGWTPLSSGTNAFEETRGLTYDKPYFILRNESNGEHFYGQLAWATNYMMEFNKNDGLSFQIGPSAANALRVIAAGETITTPAVHLGMINGDFDATVQAMHDHVRRSVSPRRKPERSYLVQYQIPPDWPFCNYRDDEFNEENMKKSIDMAATVGCELFLLDGPGWCVGCGNWLEANPKRFPRGLGPLVEYAHNKGLLFGLYAEPEGGRDGKPGTGGSVGGDCAGMTMWKDSKVFRQHPDWFSGNPPVLNLSIPGAAAYFETNLGQIIERHQLDLYRHDFCAVKRGQGSETRRDGFMECDYWRHYGALYGTFRRLRAKYPNLILQQAANGNARLDLGTVGAFHEQFTSDWAWYPYAYRMLSGLSVELPPEIYGHGNGMAPRDALPDLDTTLRCAYAAGNTPMIFNALLPKSVEELTPEIREKCLHYAGIYKQFIRPLLPTCKVYHHAPVNATSSVESGQWFAMEFTSPDRTKAWALVVRFPKAGNQYLLKPKGLDSGKEYSVTFDNTGKTEVFKGSDLMRDGVTIRLDASRASELLLLEAR
ncbi:MAG: ThuA domain-containing protein [Pirellulales bacterium]|nr:ThuA domain-containing protein [Pirellulales bacterium]